MKMLFLFRRTASLLAIGLVILCTACGGVNDTTAPRIRGDFPSPDNCDLNDALTKEIADFHTLAATPALTWFPTQFAISFTELNTAMQGHPSIRVYKGLRPIGGVNETCAVLWPGNAKHEDDLAIKDVYILPIDNVCPANCDVVPAGGIVTKPIALPTPPVEAAVARAYMTNYRDNIFGDPVRGFGIHTTTLSRLQAVTVGGVRAAGFRAYLARSGSSPKVVFMPLDAAGLRMGEAAQCQGVKSVCPKNCEVYNGLE